MGNSLQMPANNNITGEGNVHIAGVGNDIETGVSGVREARIGTEITAVGGGGGGGELQEEGMTADPPIRAPEAAAEQPTERKMDIDMLTKIAAATFSVAGTVTMRTTQNELFSNGVLSRVYKSCLVILFTLGVILYIFTFVGTVVRDEWMGAARAIANTVAWALLFLLLLLAALVIYAVVV